MIMENGLNNVSTDYSYILFLLAKAFSSARARKTVTAASWAILKESST